ncbi:MAG: hypothetical protein HY070_04765 [Chloroflexi bacterium]|nr:hypothetical protein [Chloroflexota bacterium]MBI3740246.1 hypothetical protein [Chloroflexota bacterium]
MPSILSAYGLVVQGVDGVEGGGVEDDVGDDIGAEGVGIGIGAGAGAGIAGFGAGIEVIPIFSGAAFLAARFFLGAAFFFAALRLGAAFFLAFFFAAAKSNGELRSIKRFSKSLIMPP